MNSKYYVAIEDDIAQSDVKSVECSFENDNNYK
jgi:hypothetical protein